MSEHKPTPSAANIKRKASIAAAIPVLIAAGLILALQLRPGASPAGSIPKACPATASPRAVTPCPSAAVPSASPTAIHFLAENCTVKLFMFGEEIQEIVLRDDDSKKIVDDAILDGLSKSVHYPSANIDSQENKIILTVHLNGQEKPLTFTVYDKDGMHLIQSGDDGDFASGLGDKTYAPLKELAMGYRSPGAVTVISGGNTIHAFGSAVSSQGKADGLCADMHRYTPQQLANYIEYLTLDSDGFEPFTPFRNGTELYGLYTVYGSDFNEVKHIEPSGLAPQTYLFANAKPGKYIVLLETACEDEESTYQMQYYFGVNYSG